VAQNTATLSETQKFMSRVLRGYRRSGAARAQMAQCGRPAASIGAMSDRSPSESSLGHRNNNRANRAGPIAVVALLVAIAALGLAGWMFYQSVKNPDDKSEPTYSDTQRAEAKIKICTAVDVVRRGVSLNTNLQPAGGPEDVTGSLAVAANARVALYNGGQYLIARLDPATPNDLADAVRKFGNNLMDIGAAATAGAQNTDPAQAARLRDADSANATVVELCK
jgi:hypothetical protein